MYQKDNTAIVITSIAVVGCVTIVAIFAMFFIKVRLAGTGIVASPSVATVPADAQQLAGSATKARPVDVASLKSTDGQPLFMCQPAEDGPAAS